MPWPDDPRYYFALHTERTDDGRFSVFVTVQTVRQETKRRRPSFFDDDEDPEFAKEDREEERRMLSRLALKLDLPDRYRDHHAATTAAYEAARRFVAGQLSADRPDYRKRVKDYQLIGSAGYRPDVKKWEPTLTIKRKRAASAGGTQVQKMDEESSSPFRANLFPSADRAAGFALEYGELMVINAVPGLKI